MVVHLFLLKGSMHHLITSCLWQAQHNSGIFAEFHLFIFLTSTDTALSAWNARRESSTTGNSQTKESIVPNLVILDTRNKQQIDADVVAR